MKEARVQIVDEQDRPSGSATKQEAFAQGLIRRVIRGLTEDESGRLLLHKRAPHKRLNPNLWDWLPSGHVDEGETYDQALQRETVEELGVTTDAFTFSPIETYYASRVAGDLTLKNFSRVYKISISSRTPIRLDTSEATEFRWFTKHELAKAIADNPEQFAGGVHRLFPKYFSS